MSGLQNPHIPPKCRARADRPHPVAGPGRPSTDCSDDAGASGLAGDPHRVPGPCRRPPPDTPAGGLGPDDHRLGRSRGGWPRPANRVTGRCHAWCRRVGHGSGRTGPCRPGLQLQTNRAYPHRRRTKATITPNASQVRIDGHLAGRCRIASPPELTGLEAGHPGRDPGAAGVHLQGPAAAFPRPPGCPARSGTCSAGPAATAVSTPRYHWSSGVARPLCRSPRLLPDVTIDERKVLMAICDHESHLLADRALLPQPPTAAGRAAARCHPSTHRVRQRHRAADRPITRSLVAYRH